LHSSSDDLPVQPSIKSGKYIFRERIVLKNLRTLPIPYSNKNYAFLQSLDKECNIVVGSFTKGFRKITLFKDKNVDGKVDQVVHWFVDRKKYKIEPRPGEFCSPEKFKKMKEEIITGKTGSLFPNPEGTEYLMSLLEKGLVKIAKMRNGYLVVMPDQDNMASERIKYSFSDNANRGVDLVFEVRYWNRGSVLESPIIRYSVYCKNSKDGFISGKVKELIKITADHCPDMK